MSRISAGRGVSKWLISTVLVPALIIVVRRQLERFVQRHI